MELHPSSPEPANLPVASEDVDVNTSDADASPKPLQTGGFFSGRTAIDTCVDGSDTSEDENGHDDAPYAEVVDKLHDEPERSTVEGGMGEIGRASCRERVCQYV